MISRDCYCASIDLFDAYYSVNRDREHRKYLRFKYNNMLYQFTCLPNGISPSACAFTKFLKPPLAQLRAEFGLNLDDLFIVDKTPEDVARAVDITIRFNLT